jgi:hypothetical protein
MTEFIGTHIDTSALKKKLIKLQQQVGIATENATYEVLERIHKQAMINLEGNLDWGHGVNPMPEAEDEQIRNSVVMNVEKIGNIYRGSIEYTSPHARLQEYGANYVYKSDVPMPIGYREGHVEAFSYSIIGNIEGKYYLTSAILSERAKVNSIFKKHLSKVK